MGRIMTGKAVGKKNAGKFEGFIAERERLNDWESYVHPNRSRLLRGKIVEACGFTRNVLLQNPIVVGRLLRLENELRERKILMGERERETVGKLSQEGEADRDNWLRSLEDQLDVMEATIREIREDVMSIDRRVDDIVSC